MCNRFFLSVCLSSVFVQIFNSSLVSADTLFDQHFDKKLKEAEAGNDREQYRVGLAYQNGHEVALDVKKAVYWFEKSANAGNAKAMFKLGYIYATHKDFMQRASALKWITKAAKADHPEAALFLARSYFNATLTSRDLEKALFWAQAAKKAGESDADDLLSQIAAENKKNDKPIETRSASNQKLDNKPITRDGPKDGVDQESKQVAVPGPQDSRDRIAKTSWSKNGKPAELLPSKINKCESAATGIRCLSDEFSQSRDDYKANVRVESRISSFMPNGSFLVEYKINYLKVTAQLSGASSTDMPKLGWQQSYNKMRCRLENDKNVRCATEDLRSERFQAN